MTITNSMVEQTTAITDLLLALVALICVFYLRKFKEKNSFKVWLWTGVFSLVGVSAFLGTIAHGFEMSEFANNLIWQPLYLSLGLLMSFFISAAIYDIWGMALTKKLLPYNLALGVFFYGLTLIWSDTFIIFSLYQATAMLFALFGYIVLNIKNFKFGLALTLLGIAISITAAVLQTTSLSLFLGGLEFNKNGIYHLVQTIGIIFLTLGAKKSL